MKLLFLLTTFVVNIASATSAQPQTSFASVPEEFIFRLETANTFTAETATADLGPATQSGAFFGSLQVVGKSRIRLNLGGQYFDLPARVRHNGLGWVENIYVQMSAFYGTNSEGMRRGAFDCIALSADHLRCTQTLYVKSLN